MNFDITKMEYSVDYLKGVVPTPFVSRFFNELAMIDPVKLSFSNFQKWNTGINFYRERWCLNNQGYFILAYNEPSPSESFPFGYDSSVDNLLATMIDGSNKGIYLSISGDGLRYLGDDTVTALFQLLAGYEFKATRIDVCCDIYDPDNLYVPHLHEALSNVYAQRGFVPGEFNITTCLSRNPGNLRRYSNIDPYRDPEFLRRIGAYEIAPNCFETINYTWGKKDSSRCQFRMYDKWLEVKTVDRFKNISDQIIADTPASISNYWYRMEYEMHKEYANDIFYSLATESSCVAGAFSVCAEECFFPVLCGFGLTIQFDKQQKSDIWEDFVNVARSVGDSDIMQTIHFVSKRFYSVEDRVTHVKNNCSLAYMYLMLLKAYPWLLNTVLSEGRQRFFDNKKNIPILNEMNRKYFDTNIFCRRDIPCVPSVAFEQLNLESMFDNFPGYQSEEVV